MTKTNHLSNDKDSVEPLSVAELPVTKSTAALMNLANDSVKTRDIKQVDYSLRPKVIKVAKAHLKDALRSYLLRPVVRSIEMDEPLEHLTEMRQVVIVFINVITANIEKKGLISLVNEAYKLVCGIVGQMQGCVNKMSLFDKDLLFLCIFGLRGYKHELESQIGLRCATKVRQDLLAMKNIKSVTVAVTTGMTYCGVVGHVLRREYTVIGMSVNKAARLMVAYSNKVICDRESFLHSRLEARHFILQEPRHLKGITNVGPVYEFQEQTKHIESELTWSKYPLLGREAEIKIFQQILTNLMKYSAVDKTAQRDLRVEYNTLVIKQVINTSQVSYSLIHLIFSMPLGFNVTSTAKEREDKLVSQLGHVRQPEFLCALNQPFNVHFAMNARYKALSEKQKHNVLQKFLLKLMRDCFRKLWVVIIDDAEYSDNDSMLLFGTMVQLNTVFFVLSVGHKLNAQYEVHPAVLKRAQVIELKHLDRWYHAALVCQILNVSGIPAELEKLIQEKSFGNPGWIESYLVSLMQSGSLVIMHVRRAEAEEIGYILPPISMLKKYIAKKLFINDGEEEMIEEERSDRWMMYRTSYRNDAITLGRPGILRKSETIIDEESITVCNFAKGFVPEEGNTEMTMDVMIMKIFDSLTPLDQLLLKCASVLGEIVNRSMLQYLMEDRTTREIGVAIQKLFDLRIFGCARGDFTTSTRPLIFYRNVRKASVEGELECECVALAIPVELDDLPRYASCGLMRFKMSMFRETTYRLLTETQKMDLHSKTLKYLQRNTRRCMTCGELHFTKLLGKTTQPEIGKRRRATIEFPNTHQLDEATYIFKEEGGNDIQVTRKRIPCLGIFQKVGRKLTKTFSKVDFTNCQCHLILTAVYMQMLEHWRGIGKEDMILAAILEFVEVCLIGYNIPQARRLLHDAEVLLKKMFESNKEEVVVLSYLMAKIQTLQGRCYLENGLLSEAKKKLREAINSLGYNFPSYEVLINLETTIQYELLKWRLTCPMRWKINTTDEQSMDYIELLANCLAQMFDVFRGTRGMKKQTRLAAIWSLNAALDSSRNFYILCASFSNMMITAHVFKNKSIISCLENRALNICAKKRHSLEFQELNAIAEVYAGVFFLRWSRGEISKAIRIGFITIRMAQTLDSTFLKLLILPRLAHLLMITCRHSEAVALLRELEFVSQNNLDKSGRTWYYASCADMQLDTGFTILSFQNCEQYYLREGESIISLQDPEAERRYFTSMWLWCIRMQQWEATKVWNSRNLTVESAVDEHKVAATITALKKLEGLLLLYVGEVSNRNISALNTMAEIKRQLKDIKKNIKMVKIAIPRYMLLKAYYYMIQSQKRAALKMLRRTKKLSMKVDNRMIYTWANHCQQAWLGVMSSVRENLWKEKSASKLDDEWDEIDANDSTVVPFTFPLPRYVL
ncbi:hypothetical protein DMN91_006464 [Ooceraea biroi]|uniref:Guanylate cyclase domain-containing protein n=1 Tax=Ooceraea biroi TaxID=2015173 RepID=A0A3L8DNS5_OOCBI|nr:hypothetical protein DMN91_006464 [Ooceraea biroi]